MEMFLMRVRECHTLERLEMTAQSVAIRGEYIEHLNLREAVILANLYQEKDYHE